MRAETSEMTSFAGACDALLEGDLPEDAVSIDAGRATAAPVMPIAPRRFDMAVQPAQTRAQQIVATLDGAFADERFRASVTLADQARDRGDWVTAEREYANALHLFPLHWGYCIQYAHAVKEQHSFDMAEAWYRSAVALGAPAQMVDEHLAFVARLNGSAFLRETTLDLDVPPMQAPPTVGDIRVLGHVLRVPGLTGVDLVLQMLRTAPDNRAVLLHMLAMPGFVQSNRAFLAVLGDLA